MTPGHRVTRFSNCTRATARKRAPWAQTIVRVGSTWVCYESAEDAGEEHGAEAHLGRRCLGVRADINQPFGKQSGLRSQGNYTALRRREA